MLYRKAETGDLVFDGNNGRVAGDEHVVGVDNGDGEDDSVWRRLQGMY